MSRGKIVVSRDTYKIGEIIHYDHPALGTNTLFFERDLALVREFSATSILRLIDETTPIKTGSTFNDFYGILSCVTDPIAECQKHKRKGTIREAFLIIEDSYAVETEIKDPWSWGNKMVPDYVGLPRSWWDARDDVRVQEWLNLLSTDDYESRYTKRPSSFDTTKKELLIWSSEDDLGSNMCRLESVVTEALTTLDGTRLDTPEPMRKFLDHLRAGYIADQSVDDDEQDV